MLSSCLITYTKPKNFELNSASGHPRVIIFFSCDLTNYLKDVGSYIRVIPLYI